MNQKYYSCELQQEAEETWSMAKFTFYGGQETTCWNIQSCCITLKYTLSAYLFLTQSILYIRAICYANP